MAPISSSICLVFLLGCVSTLFAKEISQQQDISQRSHQTQKRSAGMLEPVESSFDEDALQDDASLYEGPYEEPSKRGTLFRFGKRGSLFRFGKRGGSLFRFGKRGGALFRFGRSGSNNMYDNEALKRNSLFRFGKRSEDSEALRSMANLYDLRPYSEIDDVDSKRNVNSFHWGDQEK